MDRDPYMYQDFEIVVAEKWGHTHFSTNNIAVALNLKNEHLTKQGVRAVAILNNRRQIIFMHGAVFDMLKYNSMSETELYRAYDAQYFPDMSKEG